MNHRIRFDSLLNMCQDSMYFLIYLITTIIVYSFPFNFSSLLINNGCVETVSVIYRKNYILSCIQIPRYLIICSQWNYEIRWGFKHHDVSPGYLRIKYGKEACIAVSETKGEYSCLYDTFFLTITYTLTSTEFVKLNL